ncbi:MAG: hypothetical protein ACR2QH_03860 [Geminicoccaceae bacterium]
MRAKAWFISIALTLALVLIGHHLSSIREQPFEVASGQSVKDLSGLTLTGYAQGEHSLSIEIGQARKPVRFLMLPNVPESLNIDYLQQQSRAVDLDGGKITISFDNEPNAGEYSIIIFLGSDYVELVRQSQVWLKNTFNFDRLGGYTILGRRSIGTKSLPPTELTPLVFFDKPAQVNYTPASISSFEEINRATGLLRNLWSKPIQQGPTSQSYAAFLGQPFEEKMRRVKTGDFAVMCQGFRDIFLHASTADNRFLVRPIEAYNYYPQIPDLISYGHSTAEVWIEALKKWVLFDPWLGIIVMYRNIPVGAAEVNQLEDTEDLFVVPLMDSMPRMYQTKEGRLIHNTYQPKEVKLNTFSCQTLGCSPGYSEYFKTYRVREFYVKE